MILAFDPSLVCTGYAIFANEKKFIYGLISTKKIDKLEKRLAYINCEIWKILSYMCSDLDAVAIEGGFSRWNKTTKILSMVKGIILANVGEYNVPIYEYAPSQVKASVCHGGASKEDMKQAIKLITGETIDDNNAVDAIAVGLCHFSQTKFIEKDT